MKLMQKNLWSFKDADAICITTNAFIKSNGNAVMGKGCALEAKKKYHGIETRLGMNNAGYGTNVSVIYEKSEVEPFAIISFPVKPKYEIYTGYNCVSGLKEKFNKGDKVPGWACKARLDIIETNLKRLPELCDEENFNNLIVLPLPGCGAGELNKDDVIPLLEKYLDERFVVVYK